MTDARTQLTAMREAQLALTDRLLAARPGQNGDGFDRLSGLITLGLDGHSEAVCEDETRACSKCDGYLHRTKRRGDYPRFDDRRHSTECANVALSALLNEAAETIDALRETERRLREELAEQTRIYTRCPSCGYSTLVVNKHHLLCTWIGCKNPLAAEHAEADLLAARQEGDRLRHERDEARAGLYGWNDEGHKLKARAERAEARWQALKAWIVDQLRDDDDDPVDRGLRSVQSQMAARDPAPASRTPSEGQ